MLHDPFQYKLTVHGSDGDALGSFAVKEIDWEPAKEAAWMQALRRGRLNGDEPTFRTAIEPVWHASLGQPHVAGLRVAVAANGSDPGDAVELPVSYFKGHATQAAAALIDKQVMKRGDVYFYRLSAERRADPPVAPAGAPTVRLAPLSLPVASMAALRRDAVPLGPQDDLDFRVFVPQQILEEATELAEQAAEKETGSLLLGQVHRNSTDADVFVELTAQVPARHTSASAVKLTFTAQTWSAARAALALRNRRELMLGWLHTHPQKHWKLKCNKDCPPEKRASCPLGGSVFFSEEDVALQRAIFPRAFCVALLLTVTDDGMRYAMFGWRDGEVVQRGFDLLPGRDPSRFLPLAQNKTVVGKSIDENSCSS
jgi:hypothetical protein